VHEDDVSQQDDQGSGSLLQHLSEQVGRCLTVITGSSPTEGKRAKPCAVHDNATDMELGPPARRLLQPIEADRRAARPLDQQSIYDLKKKAAQGVNAANIQTCSTEAQRTSALTTPQIRSDGYRTADNDAVD
jgi:hypothetical protein